MTEHPDASGPDTAAAVIDGLGEWAALVDHVLQGLHHALNNRIGSLSALVELYRLGDLPADGTPFDAIATDIARLEDCNRMVRLLSRDDVIGEEAVLLTDVLADVLAIHRFLHDLRDTPVTIIPVPFVEPVRVERWALVRVLALLLWDAKRDARTGGCSVHVLMESGERSVRVELRTAPAVDSLEGIGETILQEIRYADKLAGVLGGAVSRGRGAAELRLPTLKARRLADRR